MSSRALAAVVFFAFAPDQGERDFSVDGLLFELIGKDLGFVVVLFSPSPLRFF
jgi:hypothetical protein